MTQHFDITAWTDYARHLVDAATRSTMQVHLATGCVTCRRRLGVSETMMRFAAVEAEQDVPESAVRLARAIFPVSSGVSVLDLPRLIARLVADSFAQPMPAGVRSAASSSRHAVFEADDFAIDVRVQRERDARDLWLVGQVQRRAGATPEQAHAAVVLVRDDTVVARTTCNAFGEFQIHCPAGRPGQLRITVDGGQRCIDVDLAGIASLSRTKAPRHDA